MRTSKRITLTIECPGCEKAFPQMLAYLIRENSVQCPDCNRTIDLEAGEYSIIIIRLAQICTEIDETLKKRRHAQIR